MHHGVKHEIDLSFMYFCLTLFWPKLTFPNPPKSAPSLVINAQETSATNYIYAPLTPVVGIQMSLPTEVTAAMARQAAELDEEVKVRDLPLRGRFQNV